MVQDDTKRNEASAPPLSAKRPTASLPRAALLDNAIAPVFSSGPVRGKARKDLAYRKLLFKAELRFLFRALRVMVRPLILLALVTFLGTLVLHFWGGSVEDAVAHPDWRHSLYYTFSMLLLEPIGYVPDNFVAYSLVFLIPLFGIFFVAEGLIKLGITVFDKERNRELWMTTMAQSARDHVILCGLGTVGYRVLIELHELGQQVFVIERNPDGPFTDLAKHLGAHVVIGDARSEDLVHSLNVAHARALIVATDDDLANLEIAMDARDLSKDIPIIMRLHDQRLANKVKATLGVNVSFSTSHLAAPLFASAALDTSVIGTHRVDGTLLLIVELVARTQGSLVGMTRGDFQRVEGMTLVALRKVGKNWQAPPKSDVKIESGDGVQVMLPGRLLKELHQLNGEEA